MLSFFLKSILSTAFDKPYSYSLPFPIHSSTYVLNSQHVHSVHLQPRDVITTSVEVRALSRPPVYCAHGLMVVLTHKDDWQIQKASYVESLILLTSIRSTNTCG